MSKRFTDTDKWDRPWFLSLPPEYKALWEYIRDKCDRAGVWYVNFELAAYLIKAPIDPATARQLFDKQIEPIGDGSRWFIPSFIDFQYGHLSPDNRAHTAIIERLTELKLGAYKTLPRVLQDPMEKDKEKKKKSLSLSLEGGVGETIPDDLKANEPEIRDWLKYKAERKESYKPTGIKALWTRIRQIPASGRKDAINNSMANGWKGIFESGGTSGKSGNQQAHGGGNRAPQEDAGKFDGVTETIDLS